MKLYGKDLNRCYWIIFLVIFLASGSLGQTWDLTGIWSDENGSRYKVRQISEEIFWAVDASPRVINVFYGILEGNTIVGKWADLPESGFQNNGTLLLRIESNTRMVKVSSSIPYGSSVWTRGDPGLPFLGIWRETDHAHEGCTSKQDFCIAYKRDVEFTQEQDGSIKARMINGSIELMGSYDPNTRTYTFSMVRGTQAYGEGKFVFSSDYRSFTGNWGDSGGHRGYWSGAR
jgi:hypothetical protein